MFTTGQDMFKLHEVIAKEKSKWNGNYEGFFAKIAKWNWKFNADGSYDITVSLVGMGDVINSLKVNVAIDKKSAATIKGETGFFSSEVTDEDIAVVATAKSSRLNFVLYNIYRSVKEKNVGGFLNSIVYNFTSYEKNNESGIIEKINPPSTYKVKYGVFSVLNATNSEETPYKPQTYITFGTLLSLISSTLSISSKNNGKNVPYILFDFNFNDLSKDNNYIATFPGNFSSNPNICLIPYEPISPDITGNVKLPTSTLNEELKNPNLFSVEGNQLVGRMAYIYLDVNFIAKTFKSSLNENNEVVLIDFLKNILNGVNNSLGGINNFRVIHNNDTNLFEIRSEVPLNIEPNPEPFPINTFGVTRGEGSFVREMDLNSELTDKYATQISIGAQANGNIAQSNSTAFSIYNKGLVDRVIIKTVDNAQTTEEEKPDPFAELFDEAVIKCFSDIYALKQFTDSNTSVLENINSQFCKLATGALTQKKKNVAPFFLPFNLSLTMDGLSGMKIYQSFKVDGKALPLTYNSKDIQLIIKSLSHDVSPEGWLTKVETLAGPIFDITPALAAGTYSESGQIETPKSNPSSFKDPTAYSTGKGGNSKVIEGVKYQNGTLGDNVLRAINNQNRYKGAIQSDGGRIRLYTKASVALDQLIAAAEKDGIPVKINSAYRTKADQQRVYNTNCPGGVCRIKTATPGRSNHGFGLAVDFSTPGLARIKEGDKLYKWLSSNGERFGFRRIASETWHWEYFKLI
jgi:LAS superfamily LD-carboxypeptidase LdcB